MEQFSMVLEPRKAKANSLSFSFKDPFRTEKKVSLEVVAQSNDFEKVRVEVSTEKVVEAQFHELRHKRDRRQIILIRVSVYVEGYQKHILVEDSFVEQIHYFRGKQKQMLPFLDSRIFDASSIEPDPKSQKQVLDVLIRFKVLVKFQGVDVSVVNNSSQKHSEVLLIAMKDIKGIFLNTR